MSFVTFKNVFSLDKREAAGRQKGIFGEEGKGKGDICQSQAFLRIKPRLSREPLKPGLFTRVGPHRHYYAMPFPPVLF